MKEIYDAGIRAGIEIGVRKAGQHAYGNASPQFPPARDMAMYCYRHMDNLNDWENEFITNMVSLTRLGYPLSIKRQDKLETIYLKLGGRI